MPRFLGSTTQNVHSIRNTQPVAREGKSALTKFPRGSSGLHSQASLHFWEVCVAKAFKEKKNTSNWGALKKVKENRKKPVIFSLILETQQSLVTLWRVFPLVFLPGPGYPLSLHSHTPITYIIVHLDPSVIFYHTHICRLLHYLVTHF